MKRYQPVFATRQPLRIAAVRQLLTQAGVQTDTKVVYPEELERTVASSGDCLVIVDGQCPPQPDVLIRLAQSSPGSRILIWTEHLSADLLLATIECGLHGLLSSNLPPREAASALRRICCGERLLRFDPDSATSKISGPPKSMAAGAAFDAQWMLDGAESEGRGNWENGDASVATGSRGRF